MTEDRHFKWSSEPLCICQYLGMVTGIDEYILMSTADSHEVLTALLSVIESVHISVIATSFGSLLFLIFFH